MKAIDLAKQMISDGVLKQEDAAKYFPELKKSGDERIREYLLKVFSTWEEKNFGFDEWPVKDIIAWLKKQGEQKDVYTKQQLRDMGFAFDSNDDIVPLEEINERIKEYLANEKKKWEKEQKPVEVEAITEGLNTEFQKQVSYLIASVINGEHRYTKGFVEWIAQSLLAYAKNDLKKNSIYKPKYLDRADEIILNSICFAIKNNIDMNKDLREYYVNFLKSLKDRVIPLPQKE